MRPNWLHRASQSASEGPVVYIRSRGEFHEAGFALGWKCRMARRGAASRRGRTKDSEEVKRGNAGRKGSREEREGGAARQEGMAGYKKRTPD